MVSLSTSAKRYLHHEKLIIKVVQLTTQAVEDESSRLDDPIETLRHISRNHREMCCFSGTEDREYQKVVAAVERVLKDLPREVKPG
jgi:hypothetical protein